jgi:hypothetical protein
MYGQIFRYYVSITCSFISLFFKTKYSSKRTTKIDRYILTGHNIHHQYRNSHTSSSSINVHVTCSWQFSGMPHLQCVDTQLEMTAAKYCFQIR